MKKPPHVFAFAFVFVFGSLVGLTACSAQIDDARSAYRAGKYDEALDIFRRAASREVYEKTLRALVDKLKAAAPKAAVLIVAPLDRAEKSESGALHTKPIIKKLVECQKKVAAEAQVGFWNTFEAMGGEGAMATWVKKGLAGSDLTHPSPQGAEVLGDLLYKALTSGFEAWQATTTAARPPSN